MKIEGRVVLITGATDGVGRLVARKLAEQGARVLAHGRDAQRGARVIDELRTAGAPEPRFYGADFSSLDETRNVAETISREHERIDVLVNNAGIGFGPPNASRQISRDGHELRFAVNYLAPFLLTRLLLPVLMRSAPARIVNVASIGQAQIDFDDLMLTRAYDGTLAYRRSKLALVMLTFDLAKELEGTRVTANCVHPATFMNTKMVREFGATPMSTVEEGAEAILHLVTGDDVSEKTGLFFDRLRPAPAHEQAYDERARERLRTMSLELTHLPFHETRAIGGRR